jgi:hypothetical protein
MEVIKLITIINSNDGYLVSELCDSSINTKSKVLIRCKHGHIFKKNYEKLRIGSWCPKCSKRGKVSIEELKNFAVLKGGKCLSNYLKNSKENLLWECKFEHQWSSTYYRILYNNSWCPKCAGNKKLSAYDMRQLAKFKKGKFLSHEYKGNKIKYLWQCEFGHTWNAIPTNISRGKWCPSCSRNKKLDIEDLNKIALKHGGYLISSDYINSASKLKWQCQLGHNFELSPNFIISKHMWCPQCFNNKSFSEELCRRVFEKIFNEKFPSIFPKWLIGNKGRALQLDGFCEKIGVAFEHQGRQHYASKNSFFKNIKEFEDLVERDFIKKNICKKYNIKLFIIPALFDIVKLTDLCDVIRSQSADLNCELNFDFDIHEIYYELWKSK